MSSAIRSQYPTPHPQVAARIADDEAIVVLADSGEVTVLNAIGTRIWELADGTRTGQQIVEAVLAEYDVSRERAQQEVEAFLQQLVDAQALVLQEQPSSDMIP